MRSATSHPLPSLPTLMAEGGGTGITTMPVLQSLAQAREKWSEHAAGAIWDASIVKIILGGASNSRDLQDLSTLIGERDEIHRLHHPRRPRHPLRTALHPPRADHAARPHPHPAIRHRHHLLRSAPPIVTDLRPWTRRKDASELQGQRRVVEELLQAGTPASTGDEGPVGAPE
jgi:type IV secretion system protein VirD4